MRSRWLALFVSTFIAVAAFGADPKRPEIGLGSPDLEGVGSLSAAIASNGDEMLAIWVDGRYPTWAHAERFGAEGRAHAAGMPVGDFYIGPLGVVWDGGAYVAAVARKDPPSFAQTIVLNRDGTIRREPEFVTAAPPSIEPTAHTNGVRTLVSDGYRVFFVDAAGKSEFLADVAASSVHSAIASDVDGFAWYWAQWNLAGVPFSVSSLHRTTIGNDGSIHDERIHDITNNARLAVISNGTSHLLAWSSVELRPGTNGKTTVTTAYMLLDRDGRTLRNPVELSSRNISYSPNSFYLNPPAVGWDGREFAIAYEATDGPSTELHLARIAADGSLVSGGDTLIELSALAPQADFHQPSFATAGTRTYLVWTSRKDLLTQNMVVMRTADSFASLAAAPTEALAMAPAEHSYPAITSNGGAVAAAWRESKDFGRIAAQIVTPSGAVLPSVVLSDGTMDAGWPAITAGGQGYMVVWTETRRVALSLTKFEFRVVARRLSATGQLLDPAPIVLQDGVDEPPSNRSPSLARTRVVWNGSNFFVGWTVGAFSRVSRVSPDGMLLDFPPIAVEPDPAYAEPSLDLQRLGDDVVAVYYARISQFSADPLAVRSTRIHGDGSTEKPVTLVAAIGPTGGKSAQVPVRTAWNGSDLVVEWEQIGSLPCVVARTFNAQGVPTRPQKSLNCGDRVDWVIYNEQHFSSSGEVDLVWDGSEWWGLTRADDLSPIAIRFDRDLNAIGDRIAISPWGAQTWGIAGVALDGRLMFAYPRLDEEWTVRRTFLQTLFLHPRSRAVKH